MSEINLFYVVNKHFCQKHTFYQLEVMSVSVGETRLSSSSEYEIYVWIKSENNKGRMVRKRRNLGNQKDSCRSHVAENGHLKIQVLLCHTVKRWWCVRGNNTAVIGTVTNINHFMSQYSKQPGSIIGQSHLLRSQFNSFIVDLHWPCTRNPCQLTQC